MDNLGRVFILDGRGIYEIKAGDNIRGKILAVIVPGCIVIYSGESGREIDISRVSKYNLDKLILIQYALFRSTNVTVYNGIYRDGMELKPLEKVGDWHLQFN